MGLHSAMEYGPMNQVSTVLGIEVMAGEALHIAVNTGHIRKSQSRVDGSLRQFAVELQIRTALAVGSVELDGALSVLRLLVRKSDEHLGMSLSDGREVIVEWGVFLAERKGERLWESMWSRNRRIGRDFHRPPYDTVLTFAHPALVHHASLCKKLDEFQVDAMSAWRQAR